MKSQKLWGFGRHMHERHLIDDNGGKFRLKVTHVGLLIKLTALGSCKSNSCYAFSMLSRMGNSIWTWTLENLENIIR